jgi:hypothetical protein
MYRRAALSLLVLALALAASPVFGGSVDRDVPFVFDEWIEIGYTDGPVTIHRVRIAKTGLAKSKIFRPTNSEFSEDVQVQIEYTNDSERDFDCDLDIVWLDAQGVEIDGYRGEEDIDENDRDQMTAAFSTLKYGLDRAATLHIGLRF